MAVAHDSGSRPQAFKFPMAEAEAARPKSALTRGVQIREFKDRQVNPEPIVIEESELLLAEYLSPRRLRDITGVDDLESVQALDIKVDTSDTSLGNFGNLLPNLRHLRLSNSCIASVRDLGSGFDQLRVLWLSRCCLEEIDGVATMCNLRELYLSYNEIHDLSPCSMLDSLQILDLEGNNVDDVCQIEFLAMCSSLKNLTLEGNPICLSPRPDVVPEPTYDYRAAICKSLPQLHLLDDEPASQPTTSSNKTSVFDADWALINELIAEGDILENDESNRPGSSGVRPLTGFRPGTGYRPGTALRPQTGSRRLASRRDEELRPLTSSVRPSTGIRPQTAGQRPGTSWASPVGTPNSAEGSRQNDASELTQGVVVCGNPSKALRARRRLNQTPPEPKHQQLLKQYRQSSSSTTSPSIHDPPSPGVPGTPGTPGTSGAPAASTPRPSTADLDPKEDRQLVDLFSEVDEWKKLNLKSKLDKEETTREAPQILRVDANPYFSSDSESEDDLLPHDVSDDVIMGADDVVKEEFAEAEDEFRREMAKSRMLLKDYDVEEIEDGDTTGAKKKSPKQKSKTGASAARFRARKYRQASVTSEDGAPRTVSVGVSTSGLRTSPRPPSVKSPKRPDPVDADDSSSADDVPAVRAPRLPPTRMPKLNLSGLPNHSSEDNS